MAAGEPSVRLAWTGRTFTPAPPSLDGDAAPLFVDETIDGAGPAVRLVRGDARSVARSLAGEGLGGQVDLVYVDPPFATERDWSIEARLDGPADGRVRRSVAYEDKLDVAAYLDMIAPRLEALVHLLSPTATIWVHLDWRAAYLVRVLLDELLGREAFVNEIVWRRAPNLGRQAASAQFGRTLDTLVVYGGKGRERPRLTPPTRLEPIDERSIKWDAEGRPFTTAPRGDYTDASIAKLDAEGRVHRSASGKVYVKYFLVKDADGVWCRERRVDALWTDVPPLRHAAVSERTGFPTQKPRALLERIVRCATEPGGLVVDLFAGSGTTGEAAHALGRRAILGDANGVSIATARARLARAGAALSVERCGPAPEGQLEVRARVSRVDARLATVQLEEPAEPLAWAIDPAYSPARPFHAAWHSERVPGAKPRAAAVEARVEAPPGAPVAVRVYGDDGASATTVVRA